MLAILYSTRVFRSNHGTPVKRWSGYLEKFWYWKWEFECHKKVLSIYTYNKKRKHIVLIFWQDLSMMLPSFICISPKTTWKADHESLCTAQFKFWVIWKTQYTKLLFFKLFVASAGGVIGLTLGISMVSFVEPIYFLTIRRLFARKPTKRLNVAEKSRPEKSIHKEISRLSPTQIFVQSLHKKNKDGQQFVVKRIPRAWIQN